MDKRWILIIIIAIIGIGTMYQIVSNSTSIGTPITTLNKSIVTIPNDFTTGDSDKKSTELFNKSNTDERVYMEDLGKGNISLEKFNNKLSAFSKDSNIKIIKNVTNITEGIDVHTIYYQKLDNADKYESVSYISCINHTFYFKIYGYDNMDDMEYPLTFIVDTLQPDYKRTQN